MEILGRPVEAVKYQYGNAFVVTAYVNQLPDDCRKRTEPSYECINDCGGRLVIARFADKTQFFVKALVPVEVTVNSRFPDLIHLSDLPDLEAVTQEDGYELRPEGTGKILYFLKHPIATYDPCGLSDNPESFSPRVAETIDQLTSGVDELYEIAQDKPLEALLEDRALATMLHNPALLQAMALSLGDEGTKLIDTLKSIQARN